MTSATLRHRRENLKKCSLAGLESTEDLRFFSYPTASLEIFRGFLLLEVGAPPLSEKDREKDILLIDATWRLTQKIRKQLPWLDARSLPTGFKTAYPRKQTNCPDPGAGLASIEALFLAHKILGRKTAGLLDHYHWKEDFLRINQLQD